MNEADRRQARLSDEEFEKIATRAADIAQERFYAEIGKSVVKKALWAIGTCVLAILAYLGGSGKL